MKGKIKMNKKYTNILPTVNEALEGITNLFAPEAATETTETTNTMKEVFEIVGKEIELNLSLYQWYRYVQAFHDVKFIQVEYDPNEWELLNKSRKENNGERIETYINKKARHNDDKHITIVKLVDHELTFAVEGANINVVKNALFEDLPYPLTTHVDVYRNLFNNFIMFKNRTTGESYTTMMRLDDIDNEIIIEKMSDDLTHIFPNLNIDEGEYEDILKLAAYVDYFYSTYVNIKTINESVRRAFETVSTIYNYDKLHEILQSIYALTDMTDTEKEKTLVTLLEEMRFYLDDIPFDEEVSEFAEAIFEEIEEALKIEKEEIENEYSGCYIETDEVTGEILNTPLMLRSDREDLEIVKEFEVCHVCKGVYYYNRKLGMFIQENEDCSYCKN